MAMTLWVTLTLMLVGVAHVHCQGRVPYDWLTAPYDNEDFNTQVHYTDDAVLECNDSRTDGLAGANYLKWITPELRILYPGDTLEFDTLDGVAGWTVSDDGYYLNITLTNDRHFGMYYCMLEDGNGDEWVVKTAVNFKGAYWGNLWYRYEQATIYSIVGSVICGLIFTIGAIIWTRIPSRYEEMAPEEDNFDTILSKLGYDNQTFENDDGGYQAAMGNGKPTSDMQIRERTTAAATHSTPPPSRTYDNAEEPAPVYTALAQQAPTTETSPTYISVQPQTSPITSVPQRSDSPVQNDDPPVPYETVVEINGTAKALGQSPGQENINMVPVGGQQGVQDVPETLTESVKF